MKEYHKIETLYQREETGKHDLIIGKFRNPTIEQVKDCIWQFTEKVDGTNVRIHWDGHKIEWGGRTDNAQLHADLIKVILEKFCTPEIEQVFEQKFGDKEIYLFMEGYGAGIQSGGGYRKDKGLILFDVQVGQIYLHYEDVVSIAETFNIEVVPLLTEGTIEEGIDFTRCYSTSFLGEAPLEGVVGRLKEDMFDRFGNRMIVKLKRCDLSNFSHLKK